MNSYNKNPSFMESLRFVHNFSLSVEENMTNYGDLFKLKLPLHAIYAVAGPQILHDILTKNDERFKKDPEDYTYIPFGTGKHACIGRYLAQPMMILALAQFLQKFDFEMKLTEPVFLLSLATLKPNQPLLVNLKARKLHSTIKAQIV